MSTLIEDDSTLTDRYQTTVPASIRRALKLKRRDRIHYTVRPDGEVVLTRASDEAKPDPVMVNFLNFLERLWPVSLKSECKCSYWEKASPAYARRSQKWRPYSHV